MAYQFSPIKCMSWWLVLKCLIVAVIAFIIGRWFGSFGTVTIKATYAGAAVEGAEVFRGEDQLDSTPSAIRGRRGETISLTVRYQDAQQQDEFKLERGRSVRVVKLMPQPPARMRLTFTGFDTAGERVPDVYMWTDESTPPDLAFTKRPVAQLTHDVGTEISVDFKSALGKYAGRFFGPDRVVWQDKATYDEWVRTELPKELEDLTKGYNREAWARITERLLKESSDVGHEYPAIFLAPGHTPSGGTSGGTSSSSGGGTTTPAGGGTVTPPLPQGSGPDVPIPYSITSKRKLTAADIQGKSSEALRLTRNELFARRGYKFGDAELASYFKKQSWYQPSTSDVSLSGVQNDNAEFLRQHE